MKRIRDYIFSQDKTLEERRFLFASLLVCFSLFIVFVTVLATQSRRFLAVACLAAIIVTAIITRASLRRKRYNIGSIIIVLTSTCRFPPSVF